MRISISPFMGEIPKIPSKLLPENHAEEAINCDLSGMSLKPAKGKELSANLEYGIKSVFRHPDGTWFRWSESGVSMVASPLNNDVWQRLYWTGDGPPKMATSTMANTGTPPGNSYRLGVPAPASAVSASATYRSEPPEDGGYEIDTVYAMTFISEYGEEGPPSPVSNMITRWSGDGVSLDNIPVPPTGSHNITKKRLYRAETSGSFLFVADIPASQTSWTDTVATELLGEVIPSIDWDMPDSRMTGLTHIGNGILAGWFENTLCFSEQYRPHAWPVGYQMGFDSNIIGVTPVTGGLIIATEREPWLITGASPAAMAQSKLDFNLGCVSRESVVDMGEYAVYASHEGLVAVGGGNSGIITESLISRDQWQSFNPTSIRGFRWREKYLALYEQGSQTKAFLIDKEQGLVHLNASGLINGWNDPASGELFVFDSSGNVYRWHSGNTDSYFWKSKIFTLPHRSSMAVGRVDADSYPATIKITADGEALLELEITDERMFRLPAGRYRHWQIELSGAAEIYSVQLAGNPTELL